ncbi:MAG: hypothetical protein KDE55_00705 [Novosphingobium sp.]|nr:hypothetical protein [Novosphingobium sp.]
MFSRVSTKFLAATACAAMIATPALAKKANDLTYINGQNAGSAQNQLEREGFKYISSNHNSMGYTYSYWWDGQSDNCVRTEVYRGVVETIADATDQDCGHHKGSTAAGVGAVAGLAILGAALASKSHHREGTNYDQQQTADFDRGYKDGLYNGAYHNYSRSDAYSNGYEKGVDERNANLSHHHNRGGYAQVAQFKDLEGARAAGGMDELQRRGFTQVDNFTSGNTRYSIQSRPASHQCLQVTIADGHFYDIRDIGQHPKCR